jgi:acyl carrier protein
MSNGLSLLERVFRVVLDLSDEAVVTKMRRLNEPKWDSLAQATLVAAIESEFKLTLSASEIDRITSFSSTKLLLEERGLL